MIAGNSGDLSSDRNCERRPGSNCTEDVTMTAQPARRARLAVGVATAALLLLLIAAPASAHVTANPGEVTAGDHAVISLRVPHGCDGSPTTSVSVQIPDTVASVTPEFVPGWKVDTTTGPLAEPVEVHGETVSEGIREVTWSGGTPIPDGMFFDFGLTVLLPDEAGETLYFPTVQTCQQGETAWIEVPGEGQDGHDLEAPAPAVTLTAADGSGQDHGDNDRSEASGHDSDAAAAETMSAELTAEQQSDRGNALTIIAILGAALALLVGLAALFTARRRTS